mmetsp:Transcript_3893/g.5996  ORF Transcript_3893/g.5996 Transcript_3893/m.5996 type:complete len:89 (+) Transcript_3893:65-331(+)
MFKNIVVRSSTGIIILNYTSPDQPNKCKFLPVYLVSSICGMLGKPMHSALPYISDLMYILLSLTRICNFYVGLCIALSTIPPHPHIPQ